MPGKRISSRQYETDYSKIQILTIISWKFVAASVEFGGNNMRCLYALYIRAKSAAEMQCVWRRE